jgi:hypothetical protein
MLSVAVALIAAVPEMVALLAGELIVTDGLVMSAVMAE